MRTTPEGLARRAARCKRWRWMEGMSGISPARNAGDTGYMFRVTDESEPFLKKEYPNLHDPATLGCLLYLVREVWDKASLSPMYSEYEDRGGEWALAVPVVEERILTILLFTGRSEEEVLVKALEAAP